MAGTGWNEVGTDFGRSRPRFLNQFGGAEPPQFQPRGAQKQPKLAQIGQNGGLKVLVVPNGWNSVERRWNGLWEVQVEDFEPIWRSWVPPNLAQGPPKTAQIGPSWPKWRSVFCYRTPDFVNGPFVALAKTVDLALVVKTFKILTAERVLNESSQSRYIADIYSREKLSLFSVRKRQ